MHNLFRISNKTVEFYTFVIYTKQNSVVSFSAF